MAEHKSLAQMEGESASRRKREFWEKMARQNEEFHRRKVAHDNYLIYAKTPEEKAINRAIWLGR